MEKTISNIASEHISEIAKFEDDLRENHTGIKVPWR